MDLKSRTINLTDAIADIRQFQTFCEKALTSHDKCNADAPQIKGEGVVRTELYANSDRTWVVERWDFEAGVVQEWHQHPEGKCGSLVSGVMILSTKGGVRTLTPIDTFHLSPGETHKVSTKIGASLIVVVFDGHPAHGAFYGDFNRPD